MSAQQSNINSFPNKPILPHYVPNGNHPQNSQIQMPNSQNTTILPIAVPHLNYFQDPHYHSSEFSFANYIFIAVLLSFIVGTLIYSINPSFVQKSPTNQSDSIIEQPPHLPTIVGITVCTFILLLIIPIFV